MYSVTKHRVMVEKLKRDPDSILVAQDDFSIDLIHMALGIAGESGEVVELIKKFTMNGKPLDRLDLMKEIGDILFYIQGLCHTIGADIETVMDMNIEKLSKRYPGLTYSDAAAAAKRDES
jgi:NTP pyrophosphatase (non-canonical NTP hydrolase)